MEAAKARAERRLQATDRNYDLSVRKSLFRKLSTDSMSKASKQISKGICFFAQTENGR